MSVSLRWSHTALLHEMPGDSIWTKVSMENPMLNDQYGEIQLCPWTKMKLHFEKCIMSTNISLLRRCKPHVGLLSLYFLGFNSTCRALFMTHKAVKNETQWSSMWCLHSGKWESPLSFQWVHMNREGKRRLGQRELSNGLNQMLKLRYKNISTLCLFTERRWGDNWLLSY